MKIEVVFYETDESFDYGDFTHYQTGIHGIEFDVDSDNQIVWNTLNGFGDYCLDYKKIQHNKKSLLDYILENWTAESEFLTGHSTDDLQEILLEPLAA